MGELRCPESSQWWTSYERRALAGATGPMPSARPHPLARLDGDKLEQVLEIVGQILGFLP